MLDIDSDGTLNAVQQTEENFSLIEKNKLASIQEGANYYTHPDYHPASMIQQEFGLRFMTDNERIKLSEIENRANNYIHPANHPPEIILDDPNHRFMTDTEKLKLNNIEENANNYVHPNTHLASVIVEDSNHRFVTDSERIKLAGIADMANNYVHPTFHSADMIQTDDLHRFVTDQQISEWNNKASLTDIDSRIQSIVGAAPDALDTLSEIAASLGNDEDFAATMTSALAGKVNKVTGMGLSETSFTNNEKTKLAGIEEFANNYVHPETHPASIIVENSSRRFITDAERMKLADVPDDILGLLAGKVDIISGMGLSEESYTTEEKSKLSAIEDNANKYVHPINHAASMILEDSLRRFVTDGEKAAWNAKDQYNAGNLSHWSGSSPATVQDAIDRIAAEIFSMNGNTPI